MSYVLFTKMDKVFSQKTKTLKNTGKLKKTGKVREFLSVQKRGTMITYSHVIFHHLD